MNNSHRSTLVLGSLALTAGLLMTGAPDADAETSSAAERRGYYLCLDKARATAHGFSPHRTYFVESMGPNRQYFINAAAWVEGDRATVRVDCQTSASGRRLMSLNMAPGRYVQATDINTFEVAEK